MTFNEIVRWCGFAMLICMCACRPDHETSDSILPVIGPDLPYDEFEYTNSNFPDHFGSGLFFFDSTPENNPVTNEGATLGRVLFYDVNLSINRAVSCGSCHKQANGFADPTPLSVGHNGELTRRNAPHLVNMQFNRRLFWDLGAEDLETQVIIPITDVLEMGLTEELALNRIESLPYYDELFEAAFGDEEISMERVSLALSQFIRSITSYSSKYDQGIEEDFINFSESENLGRSLFFNGITRCNQCHFTVNFYNSAALNNGLDVEYSDNGQGEITGNLADQGRFKVPSLRNVAVTAPYMHDGRFGTLEEVIEHYNSGVQPHPYLDERVTNELIDGGTPYQLNLTTEEKTALVDFLKTLTDFTVLNDERFADPFH